MLECPYCHKKHEPQELDFDCECGALCSWEDWVGCGFVWHWYPPVKSAPKTACTGLAPTGAQAEGEAIEPSDTFSVPLETAQELMDSLWQCGIRPSEGTGSAGSLKATQDHLKDLQEFSRRLLSMVESTPSNKA